MQKYGLQLNAITHGRVLLCAGIRNMSALGRTDSKQTMQVDRTYVVAYLHIEMM